MKEQDKSPIAVNILLPAKREEITPDTFSLDPQLAKLGFTDRLPTLVRNLNYELGGNLLGEVEDEPRVVSYTFHPHRLAPRGVKEESYSYGPRIELETFPQRGYASLKIGELPFITPSTLKMSYWVPLFTNWLYGAHITCARLPDLQQFVHELFPDRQVALYRSSEKGQVNEDLNSLTLEKLEKLPTTLAGREPDTPYMVKIEGTYDPKETHFDPFLVLGIDDFYGPPGSESVEQIFYLNALIYRGGSAKIEKILEHLRQLCMKNPLVEVNLKSLQEKAKEARRKALGES